MRYVKKCNCNSGYEIAVGIGNVTDRSLSAKMIVRCRKCGKRWVEKGPKPFMPEREFVLKPKKARKDKEIETPEEGDISEEGDRPEMGDDNGGK